MRQQKLDFDEDQEYMKLLDPVSIVELTGEEYLKGHRISQVCFVSNSV